MEKFFSHSSRDLCRMPNMFKDEMTKRTANFALRIIKMYFALEKKGDGASLVLGKQLLRCGTSVGANFRAACHGKSRADFLAKLKICEEEADECEYWLELLELSGILSAKSILPLRKESHEIASVISACAKSTKNNPF